MIVIYIFCIIYNEGVQQSNCTLQSNHAPSQGSLQIFQPQGAYNENGTC